MSRLNILEHPDPVLRRPSAPVTDFDDALATLIDDLFDTMAETRAIGLSAPQAGCLQQVIAVHVPDDGFGPQAYVNPEILDSAVPGIVEEGCLSVPGVLGNVVRATRIRVRAQDRHGETFERDVDGMHAVCVQHEMDHLVGKLFIDRLSWFKRLRVNALMARRMREQKLRQDATG
jgi:peptide deformylase